VERYPIIYGAVLKVRDGQAIQPNQVLAEWDPFNIPILTEVSGEVKFGDIWTGSRCRRRGTR